VDFNINRLVKILMSVACIIICSHLSFVVPISETGIPITGQTLAISLVIFFLGFNDSILAISIYLFLGVAGFPVFADGASGMQHLVGKSGGYLYGFLITAFLMNKFHLELKKSGLTNRLMFFALITMYILLFGMVHLGFHIGFEKAFVYGVKPFLLGGMIKVVLAFVVSLLVDRIYARA